MALQLTIQPNLVPTLIEPLLDVKPAAHLLGISVKTLRDWIQDRRIEHVKVETIRDLSGRIRDVRKSDEDLETSSQPLLFLFVPIQRQSLPINWNKKQT